MSDKKGILKLAHIKGRHIKDITVTGKLGSQMYYCLSIKVYKSTDFLPTKYSAFFSVCHASDNTNNHYGLATEQMNQVEAIDKAIKDSGINGYNVNEDNLEVALTMLAEKFNPNMIISSDI